MPTLKITIFGAEVEYEGDEKFLETQVSQLLEVAEKSHNEALKKDLFETNEDLQQDLVALEYRAESISQLHKELFNIIEAINEKSIDFLESIERLASSDQATLLAATKQMQEMQMSFNLRYLELQSQMQHENRSFTALSNIMKQRHDAMKNSISNIR
jgi:hypothetical protein